MRRTVLALSFIAGCAVFCLIASAQGGDLDSLNQEIAVQSDSLYGTWYGSEIQTMPADSIPSYLSFLLSENKLDTITAYKVAMSVQRIAAMHRRAAHLKSALAMIPEWQGTNEVRTHSHTVAVIDRWFERPVEPVIRPVRHKLEIDEPDPFSDILN
jgi:hypothetical protein